MARLFSHIEFPVSRRLYSDHFLKDLAEMPCVRIPDALCDIAHAESGLTEQAFCLFDSHFDHIIREVLSCSFFKKSAQVARTDKRLFRNLLQTDLAVNMRTDVFLSDANRLSPTFFICSPMQ